MVSRDINRVMYGLSGSIRRPLELYRGLIAGLQSGLGLTGVQGSGWQLLELMPKLRITYLFRVPYYDISLYNPQQGRFFRVKVGFGLRI